MGKTSTPAVRFKGPNWICLVAKRFAKMRQTQNVTPSNMNVTLTGSFFFIVPCFVKGGDLGYPCVIAAAKVRLFRGSS